MTNLELIQISKMHRVNPEKIVSIIDFGTGANNESLGCAVYLEGGHVIEVREPVDQVMKYLNGLDMYLP